VANKISLDEQVAAVERAVMNHRAHVQNLKRLVEKKQRPENELLMAQGWFPEHEAALATMKWVRENKELLKQVAGRKRNDG